jgi:hypothetical protein
MASKTQRTKNTVLDALAVVQKTRCSEAVDDGFAAMNAEGRLCRLQDE